MRLTKETLELECNLTPEERLEYSKQLANHIKDKAVVTDRLTAYKSQAKATIDAHDANINSLSTKVSTGKEFREIVCDIEYDWDNKTKYWRRRDSNAICKEDIITERDLQEVLDLREKEDKEKKKQEEQDKQINATAAVIAEKVVDLVKTEQPEEVPTDVVAAIEVPDTQETPPEGAAESEEFFN